MWLVGTGEPATQWVGCHVTATAVQQGRWYTAADYKCSHNTTQYSGQASMDSMGAGGMAPSGTRGPPRELQPKTTRALTNLNRKC